MKKHFNYILNIILTTLLGLLNTIFIKPEHVGGWRNYVGYLFLILALINLYLLINFLRNKKKGNNTNDTQ